MINSTLAGTHFKQVAIEGFGMVQHPELLFPLDLGGINLVQANTGVGKTSIFSAFMWGLYKRDLKDTKQADLPTWKHKRLPSFKGTRVIVDFENNGDHYEIARHIDYKGLTWGVAGQSSLMIRKNGEIVGEALHKGNQQDYIDAVLGVDADTFLNSILFGQRMKRLIEADNNDKRELLENIFALQFVENAKENAKVEFSELNEKVKDTERDLQQLDNELGNLEEDYNEKKELVATFEREHTERVLEIQNRINDYQGRLLKAEKKKAELELEMAKFDLTAIEKNETELAGVNTEITNYNNYISSVEELTTEIEELTEVLKDVTAKWELAKDVINAIDLKEANKVKEDLKELEKEIESATTEGNLLDRKWRTLNQDHADKKAELDKAETALKEIKTSCPTCLRDLPKDQIEAARQRIHDNCGKLIKELEDLQDKAQEAKGNCGSQSEHTEQLHEKKELLAAKLTGYSEEIEKVEKLKEGLPRLESNKIIAENNLTEAIKDLEELQPVVADIPKLTKKKEKLEKDSIQLGKDEEAYNLLKAELNGTGAFQVGPLMEINYCNRQLPLEEKALESEQAKSIPPVDLKKILKSITDKTESQKELKTVLLATQEKLGRVNWWISKGFSSSGIKAFVFNAMLTHLNKAVEKYASRLGLSVKFSVDLSKPSKPFTTTCYQDGVEVNYAPLSGGEKTLIDLCLAFAMHDIVANKVKFNILITDELSEGLSEGPREIAFDLLRLVTGDKTAFVITHDEIIDTFGMRIIKVTKDEHTIYVNQ